jgi:hypothetical protein
MAPRRDCTTSAALVVAVGLFPFLACGRSESFDRADLSFFVTSVQAGNGGQIGGLAGADAHCQKLLRLLLAAQVASLSERDRRQRPAGSCAAPDRSGTVGQCQR